MCMLSCVSDQQPASWVHCDVRGWCCFRIFLMRKQDMKLSIQCYKLYLLFFFSVHFLIHNSVSLTKKFGLVFSTRETDVYVSSSPAGIHLYLQILFLSSYFHLTTRKMVWCFTQTPRYTLAMMKFWYKMFVERGKCSGRNSIIHFHINLFLRENKLVGHGGH